MTPKSRCEIERAIENLVDTAATDQTDAEDYAISVEAVSGDEAAIERCRELPAQQQARVGDF